MKKHLATAGIILIFFAGLMVFLYPIVSDYINSRRQTRVVFTYLEEIEEMDYTYIAEMLEAAHSYNETLRTRHNRFVFSDEECVEYRSLLDVAGRGVIGILEIDLINVMLPIYHGTDESVLQIGAGHLEGSSLPVGGEGTHAVITGHRGLPSSTLLTRLDRLAVGDTFSLQVLNEMLIYQVNQILIVAPYDTSALNIVPGMDYCTLITCTPYGINSHRMLVRGIRVGSIEEAAYVAILPEARRISTELSLIVSYAVALAFISVVCLLYLIFKFLKKLSKK